MQATIRRVTRVIRGHHLPSQAIHTGDLFMAIRAADVAMRRVRPPAYGRWDYVQGGRILEWSKRSTGILKRNRYRDPRHGPVSTKDDSESSPISKR